jgi:hypothetical protein
MPETSLFERRQAIFARVTATLNARGTPISNDPRFTQLVDEWASGKIELNDLTRGYSAINARDRPVVPPASELPEEKPEALSQRHLLAELEQIIGMYEPGEPPLT